MDLIGTDPSSYPTIGLNVRVDSDAGRDGRLTEDDFTVTEGGEERELTGFEFSSTQLDLVFVFDDTGSMFNEIAGAKQQSKELTQQIADSGVDARYGLVSFKDDVEVDLSLTDDAAALQDALDDLFARGGGDGPEDNFDAIERALEFDFRDGAQKVFIDITDNIAHYRGDGSGFSEYTLEEVKTDLMEQGVTYVAVSPGFDDEQASKQVLAEEVGGLYVDINGGDFDRILERITGILVESYIVRYETPLPPGTDVPIGVIVQDPERGEGSDSGRVTIPEGRLDEKIGRKEEQISSIRESAGAVLGDTSDVDVAAEGLIGEIDDRQADASTSERAEMEEALDRVIAAESVTSAATDRVTREDGITDLIGENVMKIAATGLEELITSIGGGLLKSIAKNLARSCRSISSKILDGLSSNIPSRTAGDFASRIDDLKSAQVDQLEVVTEADPDSEVVRELEGAVSDGTAGVNTARKDLGIGEDLFSGPVQDVREVIEGLPFGPYYDPGGGQVDFPTLLLPTPDTVRLPDLTIPGVDLPDEKLPFFLQGVFPDRLPEIEIRSPDIDLPEVPVLDDVNDVREGIAAPSVLTTSGVDASLDRRVAALDDDLFPDGSTIGTIPKQDPTKRERVKRTGVEGITAIDDLIQQFIDDVLDTIAGFISEVQRILDYGALVASMVALLTSATVIGGLTAGAIASILGTASLVLTGYNVSINAIQVAAGLGSLGYYGAVHDVTTDALLASDLGGVTID